MDRLDFSLPDFTRLSWVSDSAREVWEPRLSQITKIWLEIEWLSVASGLRRCCITTASPEDFLVQAGKWVKLGLNALPVEIQGVSNYSYSSTQIRTEFGKPFVFRFVLGTSQDVSDFKSAWDAGNDQEIGSLLGYPRCCYEFFKKVWVEQGMVDTTWPLAVATMATLPEEASTIEITGPSQANILWRWMGIRAIPHLPCRLDCKDSVELGKRFIEVGREAAYNKEMDWLLDILSWPVEWSALHGIAEIKTPVLKVTTRTDATARKYVVQRKGDVYPLEGVHGLTFPYRMPHTTPLTYSQGFQRGLDNPIEILNSRPEWYASDNGFRGSFAMHNAHKPIIELATAILSGKGGNVLDLGCGNGVLLKKIFMANPEIVPFGIELEVSKIEHARVLNSQFADNFTTDDMFECDLIWPKGRHYTLAILMPGRLLETEPERAAKLKNRLKEYCDHVLVYVYEDSLTRYRNMQNLAHKVGIMLMSADPATTASLANFM